MSCYFNVILPLPVSGVFTYRVDGEAPGIKPGMRVTVQFGRKKICTAIVYNVHNRKPGGYDVKAVLSIVDDEPFKLKTRQRGAVLALARPEKEVVCEGFNPKNPP